MSRLFGVLAILLLFNVVAQHVLCEHQLKLFLNKVEYESDPAYFKMNINFQNNTDHHILLDVDTEVLQDLDNTLLIEIDAYYKQGNGDYYRIFKTQPRNMCELFANPSIEPLFVIAFDGLKNHGNIVSACPYKIGHYKLDKYKVDPAKLPDMAMVGDFRTDMVIFKADGGSQNPILKFMWYTTITN